MLMISPHLSVAFFSSSPFFVFYYSRRKGVIFLVIPPIHDILVNPEVDSPPFHPPFACALFRARKLKSAVADPPPQSPATFPPSFRPCMTLRFRRLSATIFMIFFVEGRNTPPFPRDFSFVFLLIKGDLPFIFYGPIHCGSFSQPFPLCAAFSMVPLASKFPSPHTLLSDLPRPKFFLRRHAESAEIAFYSCLYHSFRRDLAFQVSIFPRSFSCLQFLES